MTNGNVEQFKRDMNAMVKDKLDIQVPEEVIGLALDLRDEAEQNSRIVLGSDGRQPTLADGWHAGPVLGDESVKIPVDGSRAESEVACRQWRPGASLFVWNQVYYSYFLEHGFYNVWKGKDIKGKPFFLSAINKIADKTIKV